MTQTATAPARPAPRSPLPGAGVTADQAAALAGLSLDEFRRRRDADGVVTFPRVMRRTFTGGAAITRASIDKDARTAELAFSSEYAVDRWYGKEILGHRQGECDLEFIQSGRAPLLKDHRQDQQIGVVENAAIGSDLVGRAKVRFGRGALAEQEFLDVQDGIRVNVSCGYEITAARLVSVVDDIETYRMEWRPLEISLVSVPADPSVGVGRGEPGADLVTVPIINLKRGQSQMNAVTQPNPAGNAAPASVTMTPDEVRQMAEAAAANAVRAFATQNQNAAEAERLEKARIDEIKALCGRHNLGPDLAAEHIIKKTSLEVFRGLVITELEKRGSDKPLYAPTNQLDLSAKDLKTYSLARALLAQSDGNWGKAGFERECSEAVEKKAGKAARGFFIPLDVALAGPVNDNMRLRVIESLMARGLLTRDNTIAGGATAGANLVATDLLAGSFIDLLRNLMLVRVMGATVLTGLVGNVAIPKLTAGSTTGWFAESGAATESSLTFGLLTLSPKTAHTIVDYTRDLLLQSTPSIEQLVRDDMAISVALELDRVALHGTGASNQPTGVAATAGIGSVAGGTNGAVPTWQNIVDLETLVAQNNAAIGRTGYLTNAKVRGKLKSTVKVASYPVFIWPDQMNADGSGQLNGYVARVTNQVSSALTKGTSSGVCSAIFFGNWADLLIGEWGMLDTITDNITQAANRIIRAHAFQSIDIGVRRAASFSAMLDALTT